MESWTPSPLKRNSASNSPKNFAVGRLRPRSGLGGNKVNLHINICHPHPLRASPYLPLHESAASSDYDISSAPPSRGEHVARIYGTHLADGELHESAQSFLRAHANCSAPNLTNLTNSKASSPTKSKPASYFTSKTKAQKENKTASLIHDQQARMLLIANVITVILWNWRDVCVVLRKVGYGHGEGRWYVGNSE